MKKILVVFCGISVLRIAFAFQFPQSTNVERESNSRQEIYRAIERAFEGEITKENAETFRRQIPVWESALPAGDTTLGDVYHKLGVLYYINDAYSEAEEWLSRALELRESHSSASLEPVLNTLNGLTQTSLQQLDLDKAEYFIEKQILKLKDAPVQNQEAIAELYFADGQLAYRRADFFRCREKLQLSRQIYEKLNVKNHNLGLVLNLLGVTYDLLKQPQEAIESYRAAILVFKKKSIVPDEAKSLHNIGMAFNSLNQLDSAAFFLDKAIVIHQKLGDSIEMARDFIELGKVKAEKNALAAAFSLGEASYAIRKANFPSWHPDVIESEVFLAQLFLLKKQTKTALEFLDTAIQSAASSPRPDQVLIPLGEKAQIFANIGYSDEDTAQIAFGLYQQLDSIIHHTRLGYRQEDSKISFAQKVRQIYETALTNALFLYEKKGNTEYFDKVLLYSAEGKTAALRDQLRHRKMVGFAGVSDSLLRREQAVLLKIGATTEKLADIYSSHDSLKINLTLSLELLKKEHEELLQYIEMTNPKYFDLMYFSRKNPRVQDIQAALKVNELLVEYFLGEKELVIISVGKKHHKAWVLENSQQIVAQAESYIERSQESNPTNQETFHRLSHDIFTKTLKEPLVFANARCPVTRIRIVPDGIFSALPFDALLISPINETNAPDYLIQKYATSVAPTHLHILEKAAKPRLFKSLSMAIFGLDYSQQELVALPSEGESPSLNLPFLPGAEKESSTVQAITKAEKYWDNEATTTRFAENLASTDILHLIAHGIINPLNQNLSGIVFSKSSPSDSISNLFSIASMYGLQAKSSFVFLSACNTGKGKLLGSEGVISLSRAFTYAGVKSQVMSLWGVSDKSSAEIATNFYKNLKKGQEKDIALRNSKLTYLKNCPTVIGRQPFFWAGQVAFGNTSPLYPKISIEEFGLFLLAFCAMIGVWCFFRKRTKTPGAKP